VLKPLKELAQEIGIQESDARRILIYAGLRSVGGQFDECSFLRTYCRYLQEKLFGVAAVQSAASEPANGARRRVDKFTRPRVASAVTPRRPRQKKVIWSGNLISR